MGCVLDDLVDLRLTRYPHAVLLTRIWQLRHNLPAYGAAYVALAEDLRATRLNRDAAIVSAAGRFVNIEVL